MSPATVHASPPVEVLSHSTWTESISGVNQLHVMGQVRNDSTTDNATDIRVDFNLLDGGAQVGNGFALSTLRILAPGDVSPFEDVIPAPSSHTTTSIIDGSPASATVATAQPYHSLNNAPFGSHRDALRRAKPTVRCLPEPISTAW